MVERSDTEPWRREVISRVRQHRARRRKHSYANATMELDFQAGMGSSSRPSDQATVAPERTTLKQEQPKVIEFPRPAVPFYFQQDVIQEAQEDQLAEPVLDAPRILDAPEPPAEQMDLLPAFADIQLKAEEARPNEVELPPQVAPVTHRIFAGLVDAMVVLIAGALFAMGFVMFASGLPRTRLSMLCAFLVVGCLWLMYQYLFLVYSSSTPGMQLAQLELCTFRGEPVPLSVRRWRALASVLSAFALGLGFAWAFVDEDTLGWHDRMTQTCLRRQTATAPDVLAAG